MLSASGKPGQYGVELGSVHTLVISAASEAGVVSLWDGSTKYCIALLDGPHGALSALRVFPLSRKACTCCGTLPPATFALVLSAGNTVWFYHVSIPLDLIPSSAPTSPSHITCLQNVSPGVPPLGPLLELRSQSSSTASSTPVLPVRSCHASMSEDGAAFTISGHSVLSHRVSEKDFLRRAATDMLMIPERPSDSLARQIHHTYPLTGTPLRSPASRLRRANAAHGTSRDQEWSVSGDAHGSPQTGRGMQSFPLPRRRSHLAPHVKMQASQDCGLSAASLER